MKQRWKHLIASALVLALCLSAAACGKSDDTAGDDWRASGAVVDSGTITHDGDSVDVLVTVSESSAAFYRDMPEQVLFDSVSFPVSIPDAEEAFHAISFDDIDGDGESDVLVRFLHKSGDTTEMIWIWDPVERYVFREDLSTVAVGDALSSQPYFTKNGLQINAAVEMGTFLLEDGVCSYSGLGDGYNTDDCYWEIVKNGDYTHDGIRELHFDAICYIPEGRHSVLRPAVHHRHRAASSMTSTPARGSPPQRPTATVSAGKTTISTPSAGRATAISLNSPTRPTGSTTSATGRRF